MEKGLNKLKIGDLVIKIFALSMDVLGEFDKILTNPYRYGTGLPFDEDSIQRTVQRLVRGGYLDREGRGEKATYRITSKGEKRLREQIERNLLEQEVWDGKWRMVVFDIEEEQRRDRDRFRRFIKSLGFGQLQKSIWITPLAVREELERFLVHSRLSKAVLVVETEYIAGMNSKELASRVWQLSILGDRYSRFIEECRSTSKTNRNLQKEFVRLVSIHPFLPKELLVDEVDIKRVIRSYSSLLERETSFGVHDRALETTI